MRCLVVQTPSSESVSFWDLVDDMHEPKSPSSTETSTSSSCFIPLTPITIPSENREDSRDASSPQSPKTTAARGGAAQKMVPRSNSAGSAKKSSSLSEKVKTIGRSSSPGSSSSGSSSKTLSFRRSMKSGSRSANNSMGQSHPAIAAMSGTIGPSSGTFLEVSHRKIV